jgi:hypothetical protein
MADVAKLLESLHPMREPAAPTSIAPALVTASLGCLLAIMLLVLWWQARRRGVSLRRSAALVLADSAALAPSERLAAQARLLRRLGRIVAGEPAARRQGAEWLATLDQAFATDFFTKGAGAAFGDTLYSARIAPDVETIHHRLADLFATMAVPKADRRGSAHAAPSLDRELV